MERRHSIDVREGVSVTALQATPEGPSSGPAFVYAPGAGSNLDDPFGVYLAAFLTARGYECWRFQFPYSEKGRGAPDPPAVLEATWRAVIEAVQQAAPDVAVSRAAAAGRRLVVGGRSMGGRIASLVVAKGAPVAGLALFAYPLIPPGRPTSDRAEHFGAIHVPTLFCSGTRDGFATPEQLAGAATGIAGSSVHFLDGADHGFAVLKSSGRTREDVWQQACETLLAFLGGIEAEPGVTRA